MEGMIQEICVFFVVFSWFFSWFFRVFFRVHGELNQERMETPTASETLLIRLRSSAASAVR
jgi:hypothetical protein